MFLQILAFCGLFTFISLYSKVLIGWKVYAINSILGVFLAILIALLVSLRPTDINDFVLLFIGFSFVIALCCGVFVLRTLRKNRTLVATTEDSL